MSAPSSRVDPFAREANDNHPRNEETGRTPNLDIDVVITAVVEQRGHIDELGRVAERQRQQMRALATNHHEGNARIREMEDTLNQQRRIMQVQETRLQEAESTNVCLQIAVGALFIVCFIVLILLI